MVAATALLACAALVTGCSSGSGDSGDTAGGDGGQITLRIGTFGSFGYDNENGAKLYAEYEKLNPTSRSSSRTSPTARSTGTP